MHIEHNKIAQVSSCTITGQNHDSPDEQTMSRQAKQLVFVPLRSLPVLRFQQIIDTTAASSK
jgi:hypothetical protein